MAFAIDDVHGALQWAEARANIEGQAEVRNLVEMTIFIPEAIPASDVMAKEALRLAKFLMPQDFKLHDMEDDTIDAWQECRKALRDASAHPGDAEVSRVIDSWMRFYEAYEIDQNRIHQSFGSRYAKEEDVWYKGVVALAAAWESRRLEIDDIHLSAGLLLK
jgi:Asp-tRNA(Asn)/Glu-tRNA(Gln) amidotransferase A subunit family amidase